MEGEHPVEPADLPHWLALYRAPRLGPAAFAALVARFGEPRRVLEAAAAGELAQLDGTVRAYLCSPDWSAVERDLAWQARPGHHIITRADPRYPRLLGEIPGAPPLLFVQGTPEALQHLQVALVGSRRPTPAGLEAARHLARGLAAHGVTVTSGLALGIDGAAHEGALQGNASTVAVTGTGPDRVYPARHRRLAERVAEAGAVVTEFPTGTGPRPDHFPRRNRVISGLSLATVVVEAAQRSGSLITARHALDQGREVFAVPGSIHNPQARGCHCLLREGAQLAESPEDIVRELGALAAAAQTSDDPQMRLSATSAPTTNDDPVAAQVLSALGFESTALDQVVARTGLTADRVSAILLTLELDGRVAACPGGYCRLPE